MQPVKPSSSLSCPVEAPSRSEFDMLEDVLYVHFSHDLENSNICLRPDPRPPICLLLRVLI